MFTGQITPEETKIIEEYSAALLEKLVQVGAEALDSREDGFLDWGLGNVEFAANRRVIRDGNWAGFGVQAGAPVDHSLPVMRATDAEGAIVGTLVNYACHCTTLGGDFNAIHGDWAGVAQTEIEKRFPGAKALIAIGCGADANPEPRGQLEHARAHGKELAAEVERVLSAPLKPLQTAPSGVINEIPIYLDPLPDREEWIRRAESGGGEASRARRMLRRLDQGAELPEKIDYTVQTWTFGKDLAMVFLAGEVVVDYSLRLKRQFDPERLWINAYANDVPSYIASKRIYPEGGYEVDGSMIYYDLPQRLAPDTEDRVCDEVLRQLPNHFDSEETQEAIPASVPKEQAMDTIRVRPGMQAELVAAEPLVQDPVDIAWGADGRLWVVEMTDYPLGADGKPAGRVRILEDTDRDGIYDASSLFLEGLSYPNSVMPWRDGALVISVPDILYAEDSDNDGRADIKRRLLTGFHQGNPQHLVAGFAWGLDQWIYTAHGNGQIQSVNQFTDTPNAPGTNLSGFDFRFEPDSQQVQPEFGQSQYRRTRDDWGNWFGSDNSRPGWHYALEYKYLKNNPSYIPPRIDVPMTTPAYAGPVFPASKTLSRLNDYSRANQFTSVCSLIIYRDNYLGDEFYGNSFLCEPVHNLVSRAVLEPAGATFKSARAPDERDSEFFASTDNWSRPTSVRLGPDGALYITDMYRLVIEHPEWIPEDWMRKLDLRNGSQYGRIYRVFPEGKRPPAIEDLTKLTPEELARHMDHSNGTLRDLVHQQIAWNQYEQVAPILERIATDSKFPAARAQALWALDGLGELTEETILTAMNDDAPGVRVQGVRLAEENYRREQRMMESSEPLPSKILQLSADPDPFLQKQVAYSLRRFSELDKNVASTFVGILRNSDTDPYTLAGALSSLGERYLDSVGVGLLQGQVFLELSDAALAGVLQTMLGSNQSTHTYGAAWILFHLAKDTTRPKYERVIAGLDAAAKAPSNLFERVENLKEDAPGFPERFQTTFSDARATLLDKTQPIDTRERAIELLGRHPKEKQPDLAALVRLIDPSEPLPIQNGAARRLLNVGEEEQVLAVLGKWTNLGANTRSLLIDRMLARSAWIPRLLDAMETNPSIVKSLSAAQRNRLTSNPSASIQERAVDLIGATSSNRADALAPYLAIAGDQSGDPTRGRAQFETHCANCHRVAGLGKNIGPDLTALSDRSPNALLTAILDPNRAVEPKYIQYALELNDTRALSGIIASETAGAIALVDAAGEQTEIPRDSIQTLKGLDVSLMPEGFEALLPPNAMFDLLAFVNESSARPKARPNDQGSISLTPALASVTGPTIALNEDLNAYSWISGEDIITWTVENVPPGRYAIFTDAAVQPSYDDRPFVLEIGEQTLRGQIEHTGSLRSFRQRKFGNVTIAEPHESLRVTLRHTLDGPALSLRELRLDPAE